MSLSTTENTSSTPQLSPKFTDDELSQFHRDGFVIVRGLADRSLVAQMRQVTDEGLEQEIPPLEFEADLHYPGAPESRDATGGRTVRRLLQAHSRNIVFTQWLGRPALVSRLEQLLGVPVVMPLAHHNCIMTKHPDFSSQTGWHQDIRYWGFTRPELVSVWLALGDEFPENGSLYIIPGSHLGTLDRSQLDENLFFRTDLPENQPWLDRARPVELRAGDALFFHCKTVHAAQQNMTSEVKYSAVFTFRPHDNPPRPGTRSASQPEIILPLSSPIE
ncbi:MAG: phytanoyl-CoA dioxygenase family protein [Planctomycetota bacterium]|nr:phytanoyl-CoA dioxygenase family protein [Planctomycetota bacterium]MDA1211704.1 phytanoyl-CoA dioxygenase family protein [Planctomycetota bacterium]